MENYTENFGSWQSNACGGVSLVPAYAASVDATRVSFADVLMADATAVGAGLGQPKATAAHLTHKSITRPGSPPRGRLR